jgi:two-component system, NarL family, response regulator YdfI
LDERVIRVLVAARSAVVRAGLESLIVASQNLEFAGTVSSITPEEVIQQFQSLHSDVLLIALDESDEHLLNEIAAPETGPTGIIAVAIIHNPQSLLSADLFRNGVRAILPNEAAAEEIIAALSAVSAGLVVIPPEVINSLLSETAQVSRQATFSGEGESLTSREMEVLEMIAEGLGNKTIAFKLGISEHTVKFHVSSIFSKLGASSRAEAATLGIRRGLIML